MSSFKINEKFKLRKIAGETIIVNQGREGADLTKIISLNDSARVLFEHFEGRTFDGKEVAKVLMDTYGIDSNRAENDAQGWMESLRKCGVLDEVEI